MTQVKAGGEILAIDPADYGPVVITKALTIYAADDATAIVSGNGNGTGITVNAGANDVVNLRGLNIANLPVGVRINSGSVNLEHSSITGGQYGIVVDNAGSTSISDTTITGSSTAGIYDPTSNSSLALTRVSLINGGNNAVHTAASVTLAMTDSTIVGWSTGLRTDSSSAFVKRSVISGSGTGIVASGTVYLDTTTITGCTTGVLGAFNSFSNNNIVANTTNYTSRTTVQPQVRAATRAAK